jgi:6,7-dimethyl-8-ribityllumazine synthase
MRIQLDFGVPVIFGLLTVLNEDQARKRAGLTADGHNHGEDWGNAGMYCSTYSMRLGFVANGGIIAVEMGVKRKQWADGIIV